MILLTGATGYLGSQIARELIARGMPFRALVRDPARLEFDLRNSKLETRNWDAQAGGPEVENRLSAPADEVVIGDLLHLAALEDAKAGEEYVLGGDNRALNEFFRLLAQFSKADHRVRHLPVWAGKT